MTVDKSYALKAPWLKLFYFFCIFPVLCWTKTVYVSFICW